MRDGSLIQKLSGLSGIEVSPFGALHFEERSEPRLVNGLTETRTKIPRVTFGFLDAIFTPEMLLISDVGGPIRAFSADSGAGLWSYQDANRYHYIRLAHNEISGFLAAFALSPHTGYARLDCFDLRSGDCQQLADVGQIRAVGFWNSGQALLLADGKVISTLDGNELGRVNVPLREYLTTEEIQQKIKRPR